MTDEKKDEVEEVPARVINAPFEVDQAVYLKKMRTIGPTTARKHALLDKIDQALVRSVADSVDYVEDDEGNLVEINTLTSAETELVGVAATLAALLREEWTYS